MIDNSSIKSSSQGRFHTLTKYFRKYRWYLILGGVAVIGANSLILLIPAITGRIVDRLRAGAPMDEIRDYVLLAVGLSILSGLFRFAMRRTIIWMSRYIEYDLRAELFDHLLKLSPSFFHNNRTGDIMARMTNDLEAVRQLAGPAIMYTSNAVVSLVIGVSLMLYLSPILTAYALVPLIVMPIAVNRIGNLLHKRLTRIQEHFATITAAAQENLAGIRVVKAFQQEEPEVRHFEIMSAKYIGLNLDLAKIQGVFIPMMRLVAAVSYLSVFYLGGLAVMDGSLSLGMIIAFFGYLGLMHWPVIAVGWVVSLYQRGTASLERINRILHTEPDIADTVPDLHAGQMQGKIEFRNLRFGFNSRNVLDGIDLTIDAGQTVGLVGATGSGKTALVSLLARLYPVDRGQLFIDGRDINDWSLSSLRRQVGFAPQEPFLFSCTIEENIGFGGTDHERADIREAARIAALDKDLEEFPKGYRTMVGERGITLSGGQKQRAAIARAILSDPAVLILDDATSSVDTETEHEIQERIGDVLRDRTSIIISHRVSSVKDADFIVYLDEGRIVERGSHDELVRLNGHYARLHQAQLLQMELDQL
ncbi:MAG: ABC transporter ATP-binding protein/permease [candidate division Zixibacteria bacterium]|nr:ABC transporter ATP-binding protein/permease [candidate division Zixibacteria bacterium]